MRLDGTELFDGYISACDLDNDFAVVQVSGVRDVQVGPFQSALESLCHICWDLVPHWLWGES